MASSRTEGRAATAAQFAFNAWRCARMHPGRGGVIVRRIWAVVALAIAWQSATPALADEPEKEKVVWEVINPFSPCTGDCGIAALAGKSVSQTAMTSIFIRFEPPGTWQWDNSYLVSLSASRTLVRYGKYFSIDPEIGFAKRLVTHRASRAGFQSMCDGGISPGATTFEQASAWVSVPALPATSQW